MTNVPPEVSEYFRKVGKMGGKKLFAERGSEYYRKISQMRKTHGREKKTDSSVEYTLPEKEEAPVK